MQTSKYSRNVLPSGELVGQLDPREFEESEPDTHWLAVAPRTKLTGVYSPGFQRPWDDSGKTYDWRSPPESDDNTGCVRPEMIIGRFKPMLLREYDYDAFMVGYVLINLRTGLPWKDANGEYRQPRINKEGLQWVRSQGFEVYAMTLFADIDNPGHCEWTPELRTANDHRVSNCPMTRSCARYYTKRGYRLAQPVVDMIPVDRIEQILHMWLTKLEGWGIVADERCGDWTHFMRAPNVIRDFKRSKSELFL